jgi:hypothetical protein
LFAVLRPNKIEAKMSSWYNDIRRGTTTRNGEDAMTSWCIIGNRDQCVGIASSKSSNAATFRSCVLLRLYRGLRGSGDAEALFKMVAMVLQ